jgi:hypothetical protein
MKVIQRARYLDLNQKSAALIEIRGVRFYTVVPGSCHGADHINHAIDRFEKLVQIWTDKVKPEEREDEEKDRKPRPANISNRGGFL